MFPGFPACRRLGLVGKPGAPRFPPQKPSLPQLAPDLPSWLDCMLTPGGVEAGAGYPVHPYATCEQDPASMDFNKVWLRRHGGVTDLSAGLQDTRLVIPLVLVLLSLWRRPR